MSMYFYQNIIIAQHSTLHPSNHEGSANKNSDIIASNDSDVVWPYILGILNWYEQLSARLGTGFRHVAHRLFIERIDMV